MRFACEQCQAKYSIPDARVAGKVVRLRCQRCGSEITVRGPVVAGAAAEKVEPPAPSKAAEKPFEDWGEGSTKIASLADIEKIRQAANAEAAAAALAAPGPVAPPPLKAKPAPAPMTQEPDAKVDWFAIVKGVQIGPFTHAVMASKIASQEFTARTYAWRDGMPDWLRLQAIPEFVASFASAPAKSIEPKKAEPQKMAALVDPKLAPDKSDAPWGEPAGEMKSLKDAAIADDVAELFTPPDADLPSKQAPFENAFDSDPNAPPRESTRVFMAAAGLVARKKRQRIAAISAGVVVVALLTLIGLDLGGAIEIPALGPAYRAFGIENPHTDTPAAQFNSNLSEAERQKLRDGLMGKKKSDAQKPIGVTGSAPGKADAKPDDAAKDGAPRPTEEQKMLNDLFDDSQKAEGKVEPAKVKTPTQDLPQGIGAPEITKVVEANQKAVKYCLERALSKGQPASGRMEIEFTIQPTGLVSSAEMKTQKFKGSDFADCTTQAVKNWKFPRFSGEPLPVIYPFILSAGL